MRICFLWWHATAHTRRDVRDCRMRGHSRGPANADAATSTAVPDWLLRLPVIITNFVTDAHQARCKASSQATS
jgi:hypothetical protein